MTEAPENGICDYAKVWSVTTYTSGNELRGPAVHFGEFGTERDARQALADDGFTNGQFGWRKGYTTADISPKTVYSNPRARPMTVAELAKVRSDAINEFAANAGMKPSNHVKALPEDVRLFRAKSAFRAAKAKAVSPS